MDVGSAAGAGSASINLSAESLLERTIQFKAATRTDSGFEDLRRRYRGSSVAESGTEDPSSAAGSSVAAAPSQLKEPAYELFDPGQLCSEWKDIKSIGPGLLNHGNTCYLNSVLQCLTYCPILANYLLSQEHSKKCQIVGFCAFCSLERHVVRMLTNSSKGEAVAPKDLVRHVRNLAKHFKSGRQEDSHEFLRYLLDGLQKTCLRMSPVKVDQRVAETTAVHRIFGSHLRSQIRCSECNFCSNTYDATLDLPLDISKADSLSKALGRFTRREVLDGENQYRCGKCNTLVDASKQLTLHTLPKLLTVEFMRFGAVSGGFGSGTAKIRKQVEFPAEIDLRPYTSEVADGESKKKKKKKKKKERQKKQAIVLSEGRSGAPGAMYSLCGVVVHSGHSSHSGHYVAFVRGSNQAWYEMDDEEVRQVKRNTVLKQQAYILFYARETGDEPAAAVLSDAARQRLDKIRAGRAAEMLRRRKLSVLNSDSDSDSNSDSDDDDDESVRSAGGDGGGDAGANSTSDDVEFDDDDSDLSEQDAPAGAGQQPTSRSTGVHTVAQPMAVCTAVMGLVGSWPTSSSTVRPRPKHGGRKLAVSDANQLKKIAKRRKAAVKVVAASWGPPFDQLGQAWPAAWDRTHPPGAAICYRRRRPSAKLLSGQGHRRQTKALVVAAWSWGMLGKGKLPRGVSQAVRLDARRSRVQITEEEVRVPMPAATAIGGGSVGMVASSLDEVMARRAAATTGFQAVQAVQQQEQAQKQELADALGVGGGLTAGQWDGGAAGGLSAQQQHKQADALAKAQAAATTGRQHRKAKLSHDMEYDAPKEDKKLKKRLKAGGLSSQPQPDGNAFQKQFEKQQATGRSSSFGPSQKPRAGGGGKGEGKGKGGKGGKGKGGKGKGGKGKGGKGKGGKGKGGKGKGKGGKGKGRK